MQFKSEHLLPIFAAAFFLFVSTTNAESDSAEDKKDDSLLLKKLNELSQELDKVLGEFKDVISAKSGFDALIEKVDKQYTGHWKDNDHIPADIKKPISEILEQAKRIKKNEDKVKNKKFNKLSQRVKELKDLTEEVRKAAVHDEF